MKKKALFISNLGWENKNFKSVTKIVKDNGFKGIDLAPIKINNNWRNIVKNSKIFAQKLAKEKISVNAIQGIFFKKKFHLFKKDKKHLNKIFNHTLRIIQICKIYKCKKIIIGSSGFRKKVNLKQRNADEIFINFFRRFIKILDKEKIYFCLETIPFEYKEDYIFRFSHMINIIKAIKSKWIRINFDSSLFHFKKFDKNLLAKNLKFIKNIQITEKNFSFFLKPSKKNIKFCEQLKNIKQINNVSLEIISKKTNIRKLNTSMRNLNKLINY